MKHLPLYALSITLRYYKSDIFFFILIVTNFFFREKATCYYYRKKVWSRKWVEYISNIFQNLISFFFQLYSKKIRVVFRNKTTYHWQVKVTTTPTTFSSFVALSRKKGGNQFNERKPSKKKKKGQQRWRHDNEFNRNSWQAPALISYVSWAQSHIPTATAAAYYYANEGAVLNF